MKVLWLLLAVAFVQWSRAFESSNDFSSFLTANASLAVVVDRDYMTQRGENILRNFQKILSDTIREHLKNGGLNVRYFPWSVMHLKKEFLAAITVTSCENTWKIYESSKASSVLLVAITDPDCPRLPLHRALMIPMMTNGNEFPQIILDAKSQKILSWKSAVLLVDQSILYKNPLLVEAVVHGNAKQDVSPTSLFLHQLNDTTPSRSQRNRVAIRQALEPFARDARHSNQFIVFSAFFEDIIEVADHLGMFRICNQWLFFVIDGTTMKSEQFNAELATENLDEGANIAFMQNVTEADCAESLNCTLADVSMAFVTSLSRLILEEQSIFGEVSDEEWESIRLTKKEKQDEILRFMKDYLKENSRCLSCSNWRLQTALTWGKSQEHKSTFNALRNSRNKYFEFLEVGFWTPLLGFDTNHFLFPHIHQGFRNITMDIVTLHNPPWQILHKNGKGEIVAHSGIVMEILKELSRMLNFTYKLHEPKSVEAEQVSTDNETNNLMGNLTYIIPNQLLEMIQERRFFLAAVAATIDEDRSTDFNYTVPISIQKYTFISRKPDEISRIYLFTAPFTSETWASLIGAVFLVAVILYAINCLVPMQSLRTKGLCNMKNCFWYIYGALLQQGGAYIPKTDSCRILIGIWWIVVIVLVTTYCGNLVAFLTFPKYQPGLEYLHEVFLQNDVQHFALRNGTFFQKYSKVSDRPDIRRYVKLGSIYNVETEGLDDIEKGERVNIDWRINLQLLIQRQFEKEKVCKFVLAKEDFVEEQIGLILPAHSPYLQLINEKITLLFQMGFIERWHQINLPAKDKCNDKGKLRQVTNHKVDIDDMQGCFLMLLIGFTIATLVILMEYGYYKWYMQATQIVYCH